MHSACAAQSTRWPRPANARSHCGHHCAAQSANPGPPLGAARGRVHPRRRAPCASVAERAGQWRLPTAHTQTSPPGLRVAPPELRPPGFAASRVTNRHARSQTRGYCAVRHGPPHWHSHPACRQPRAWRPWQPHHGHGPSPNASQVPERPLPPRHAQSRRRSTGRWHAESAGARRIH